MPDEKNLEQLNPLPSQRSFRRLRAQLRERKSALEEHCKDEDGRISAPIQIAIDNIINIEAMTGKIALFAKRDSLLREDFFEPGHSALPRLYGRQYLAYINAGHRALEYLDKLLKDRARKARSNQSGYFYVIQLTPELNPGQIKFGWSTNPGERIKSFKTSSPSATLIKRWPARRIDEQTLIKKITGLLECEKIGPEVYQFKTTAENVVDSLDRWINFNMMKEKQNA